MRVRAGSRGSNPHWAIVPKLSWQRLGRDHGRAADEESLASASRSGRHEAHSRISATPSCNGVAATSLVKLRLEPPDLASNLPGCRRNRGGVCRGMTVQARADQPGRVASIWSTKWRSRGSVRRGERRVWRDKATTSMHTRRKFRDSHAFGRIQEVACERLREKA